MTIPVLAKIICLASSIFGRPTWDAAKCAEHAAMIDAAAGRHKIDPVLMVAINVVECDMGNVDAPVREVVSGRLRIVGYDACPMGVRIRPAARRRDYGDAALYELAASRLEEAKKKNRERKSRKHFVRFYNFGQKSYSTTVLAVARALAGKTPSADVLDDRPTEIVRRIRNAIRRDNALSTR